ncbi:MAG: UDP-N-acetylmuramoyl-tripeptide--D-alanyl-D-alanine ligase [Gammaproteobacteria bacterium]|nr:UDP-N-acetylmuramoyl-tripeptide--D-alanyl-D-alanine ligase [Gammaproteobacteria bacterium]
MRLAEAADVLQAKHSGVDAGADVGFRGVSTDTRTLMTDNLFFALVGPRFDGHAYLDQAQARGAAAAAVSRPVATQLPLLQVADTRLALGQLARHWRGRFTIPVVGVTGSNGKTTVKEMLAAILGRNGAVLATKGNLNNDIGVPLTLAQLGTEHRSAVIELGANHAGEIAYLTQLTQPTVGIVTNAGPAHLEGFGSLEGVARAKGELFAGLAAQAIAVINADDHFAPLWRELAGARQVLSFGTQTDADVRATYTVQAHGTELNMHTPHGSVEVLLSLPGRHNVLNALAATAAALAAGTDLATVKAGLENLGGVSGRLQRKTRADGGLVLDDTYNANPASMRAAIDVLRELPGESWLVLGDMGELGANAEQLHSEIGAYARDAGIAGLFTLGPLSAQAGRTFGAKAQVFGELDALVAALRAQLHPEISLLVKGSRSAGMERVVQALAAPVQENAAC